MDVGELPIVIGDEAVGVITDRDMVIRGVAHGHIPESASVVEAMTEGVIACKEDDDIEKAAQIMSSHKIRRLPVIKQGKSYRLGDFLSSFRRLADGWLG